MTYVHASFNPAEAWPMFQRAFYTAQSLGIAAATHEQMFVAVWETGEFPLLDPNTGSISAGRCPRSRTRRRSTRSTRA